MLLIPSIHHFLGEFQHRELYSVPHCCYQKLDGGQIIKEYNKNARSRITQGA